MHGQRLLRSPWVATASLAGGFVGWLTVVMVLNLCYSSGPKPHPWINLVLLLFAMNIGAIGSAVVASNTENLPRQFSLRTLLIATTLVAVGLGLIACLR